MQFQADLLGGPVEVVAETESTAIGAAALAGLAAGVWKRLAEVAALVARGPIYEPSLADAEVDERRAEWRLALERTLLH